MVTNQEAIEHIKNIKIYSYQDGYTDEAREALDMAIKALEAQELSNNSPELDSEFGDLISRQDAIDALKNRWKKTRNYEGNGDDIAEECELYLKQVPSAQPDMPEWAQEVERMYNKALTKPYIKKPLAWALYQAWKEYDS